MKLLLINPRFPESFWSFKWAVDSVMPGVRAINPPLGLATLAALCPESWDVTIVDENIETIPLAPDADVVGICGMGVQHARQRHLIDFYRSQGYYVVVGGSYASLCPEVYEGQTDSIIAGEAEYIWREFCRDWEDGTPRALYRETGTVSLADSPVPRFDLLQLDKYKAVSLQFSRGCPFRCEFCDIIVMFGRRPRTKTVDQVAAELDSLRRSGVRNVFFVDDNLIGDKPAAKKLLAFLASYQQEHDYQFHFGTEVSLNLAQDDELLQLARAANFGWVFIGIESPNEESLKETKKYQNTRQDILGSVRKIYSHGIDIFAGFIIGFDHDTVDTFDEQYRFIMDAGIQGAMVGLLTALPKTPLYERLEREGRVAADTDNTDNTKLWTNVVPKNMSYDQMVDGYRALFTKLLEYRHIADRIRSKHRFLRKRQYPINTSARQALHLLTRFVVRGVFTGGPGRFVHFCRSVPFTRLSLIRGAMQDWAIGLAMRDYVARHFVPVLAGPDQWRLASRYVGQMERAFHRYIREGALEVSLQEARHAAANISLSLKGRLDRSFFSGSARYMERLLRNTRSCVTLRIGEFSNLRQRHLERFLKRLARYGDRIYIKIPHELRRSINIDSSVFHLVLE